MMLLGRAGRSSEPLRGLLLAGATNDLSVWRRAGSRFISMPGATPAFVSPEFPVAIRPEGDIVLVGRADSPYVQVGSWNGSALANLELAITALPWIPLCAAWHPTDDVVAFGLQFTPWIALYSWTGSALTPLDPPESTGGRTFDVRWSPDGGFLSVARNTGNGTGLTFYTWDGAELTRLPLDTATWSAPLGGNGSSTDWHPDGGRVYFGGDSSPYLHQYTRSGSFFTKQSTPAVVPGATVRCVRVSPTGEFLAAAGFDTPGCIVYSISGTTLTALSPPSGGYQISPQAIAWVSATEFVMSGFDEPATAMHRVVGSAVETVGSFDVTPSNNVERNAFSWSSM